MEKSAITEKHIYTCNKCCREYDVRKTAEDCYNAHRGVEARYLHILPDTGTVVENTVFLEDITSIVSRLEKDGYFAFCNKAYYADKKYRAQAMNEIITYVIGEYNDNIRKATHTINMNKDRIAKLSKKLEAL